MLSWFNGTTNLAINTLKRLNGKTFWNAMGIEKVQHKKAHIASTGRGIGSDNWFGLTFILAVPGIFCFSRWEFGRNVYAAGQHGRTS